MILYTATPSPFGRKVKLAAHCLGLIDRITPRLTNTNDPDDKIRTLNPLGKIPALVTDDITLYDSRVIMEYLDSMAGGGKLLPPSGAARFEVLTRAAKMDGMMDAALLVVYESRFRPEGMQVDSWLATQRGKIIRGLESIGDAGYGNGAMPDLGDIGLACLLDYLDFRKQVEWRDHAPHLVSWMTDFAAAVPGYEETLPVD